LSKKVGPALESASTISSSSGKAWRIKLDQTWELKIYKEGHDYDVAVGKLTESWDHFSDAFFYLDAKYLTKNALYPNGTNAEAYLGRPVYDYTIAAKLKEMKDNGYISKQDYENIIDKGIFLGTLGSYEHATEETFERERNQWKEAGIDQKPVWHYEK
jgi:hypothetical protein